MKFNFKKIVVIAAGIAISSLVFAETMYTFDSVNEIPQTASGKIVQGEGKYGNAMVFDGNGEYLVLPSDMLDGEGLTFAAWVYPEGWQNWMRVFDIGDGSSNICDLWFGKDAGVGALALAFTGGRIFTPLPKENEWVHLAATLGDGKLSLYVNGKLEDQITVKDDVKKLKATVKGLYAGNSNWSDPYFKGKMDNIFVASRALSAKEIKKLAK